MADRRKVNVQRQVSILSDVLYEHLGEDSKWVSEQVIEHLAREDMEITWRTNR